MKKLTAETIEKIRQLKQRGRTYGELKKMFKLSDGSIRNALKSPPQAVVGHVPPVAVTDATQATSGALEVKVGGDNAPATTLDELLRLLVGQLDTLQGMALEAKTERNATAFSNIQRTLNQTIALIDKLTPPLPPPLEEAPDMIAAAARARTKLADYLEKVRLGK